MIEKFEAAKIMINAIAESVQSWGNEKHEFYKILSDYCEDQASLWEPSAADCW
ncbi:MAG: hypothetical protein O7D30_04940 [Rickettsia endosymbiont of Ixodes persulcatus]|nr:hypothetical protein [Rickettsia endosymbiont of Ixodes persulcatus]